MWGRGECHCSRSILLWWFGCQIVFNKPSTFHPLPLVSDSNGSHQRSKSRAGPVGRINLNAQNQMPFPKLFCSRDSKFIEASYVCTTRCHPSLEKKRVRQLNKIQVFYESILLTFISRSFILDEEKACILFCNICCRKKLVPC